MINYSEKLTFAGKLAGPPLSKWEQSAQDYRRAMYSTYKSLCKKRGTDAVGKEIFVAHGLSAHGAEKPKKSLWGRFF